KDRVERRPGRRGIVPTTLSRVPPMRPLAGRTDRAEDQPTQVLEAPDRPTARLGSTRGPQAPASDTTSGLDVAETLILHEFLLPWPRAAFGLLGETTFYSAVLPTLQTAGGARLARNTVVAILARFATYGISLPLSIVTARLLGPQGRGIYAVF